jgi:phage-related minor tail protein
MPNIEENPDFQLLKQFLQSINPNDMDEASAKELMDLGRMIQNGGALTDRQREMFGSVVGAMPDMRARTGAAMTEADLMPDMRAQTGAAMTEAEMEEMRMREFNQKLQEQQQAAFDARQRDIEAGNLPTGPSAGMTEMTSPMPRMRPSNLGG